jgi:hypothetical protein
MRILPYRVSLAALAALAACKVEAPPAFAVVTIGTPEPGDPPVTLGVDQAQYAGCDEEGWDEVRGADGPRAVTPSTPVVINAFDTITYDGLNVDNLLNTKMRFTRGGRDARRCDNGEPRVPAPCDDRVSTDGLMSAGDRGTLCNKEWLSCYSALKYEWATDIWYIEEDRFREIASQCDCGATPDQLETAEVALLEAWSANADVWEQVVSGDASLTVQNTANTWTSETNDPSTNAGICGVWLYDHTDYLALTSASEDGPSLIEQHCGGVPLPASDPLPADDAEVDGSDDGVEAPTSDSGARGPMPLTILSWNDAENGFRRLGGVGDLTNAYVLVGPDHPSRACPACRTGPDGDTCSVASGAAVLTWSIDLENRAKSRGNGPVHVLVAECSPAADAEQRGWQRACWHTELPQAYLKAGAHVRVEVGGITSGVLRTPE